MLVDKLKKRRRELNITQEYMCKKLCLCQQGYGRFEANIDETIYRLIIVMKELNLTLEDLFYVYE